MSSITGVVSKAAAGKTFLITGGHTGIGYEAAKALYLSHANVIVASKPGERGQDAVKSIQQANGSSQGSIDLVEVDLASFASIEDVAGSLREKKTPIHALVNNAGVFIPPNDRTEEDFEVTLGVNHFGPFLFTHLLLDNLVASKPSRIVNTASIAETGGRPDWLDVLRGTDNKDNRSGVTIYGTTKMFNVMTAKEFGRRLRGKGVDGFACHPGVAQTPLYDKTDKGKPEGVAVHLLQKVYSQSAEDGAISLLKAATDSDIQGHGFKYFGPPYAGPAVLHVDNAGERNTSNPISDDAKACRQLYEETFKIVAERVPAIKQYYMDEATVEA
jgi:NAD(P)-dependent dehydrogenase (short-subunit alcohol dehydrogenase family)